MKRIILILSLSLVFANGYSQCTVKTIHRLDGTTVKYHNPELVGKNKSCELGVSIQVAGSAYTFNTTVLYYSNPTKSMGTLMVQLSDNNSLDLTLYTSQLAVINNNKASVSIYYLTKEDVEKLKNTTIKKIIFKDAYGIFQVVSLSKNFNVASRHIKCISQ